MVDDDQSSKTEEPTSRRLQQARERGQVAQSQDVRTWAVLVGGTLALAVLAPPAGRHLVRDCLRFIESPERIGLGVPASQAGLAHVVGDVGWLLAPTLLLLAALGLGSALAQSGLIWAPNRVQPEFGKISPLKGWQRLRERSAETVRDDGGDGGAADSGARRSGDLAGIFARPHGRSRDAPVGARLWRSGGGDDDSGDRRLRLPAVRLSEAGG